MADSNYRTREAIGPKIDFGKFCGRQNIPLQGQKDTGKKSSRARRRWSYQYRGNV